MKIRQNANWGRAYISVMGMLTCTVSPPAGNAAMCTVTESNLRLLINLIGAKSSTPSDLCANIMRLSVVGSKKTVNDVT